MLSILSDEEYCKNQRIQPSSVDLIHKTRSSISTISSKTVSSHCRSEFRQCVIENYDKNLKELTVQSKVLEFAELENSNQVWKRFQQGLPAGQLSFLLRAGTDTLPTSLILRHWRLRTDPSCSLCGHKQPTIHHILSNCPEVLQQGRYTWRHNCTIITLVQGIKEHLDSDTTLYADLPGLRASDNPVSTIPESTLVTSARPDTVLIRADEISLIELTVPYNSLESL